MHSTDIVTLASLGFSNRRVPTHRSISQSAHAIWQKWNRPSGRDLEIWLLAEQRLGGLGAGRGIRARLRERFARGRGAHRSATSL